MKRYNLSSIMKKAHNLYKNDRVNYPTFSTALSKAWKMAKYSITITENSTILDDNKAVEVTVKRNNISLIDKLKEEEEAIRRRANERRANEANERRANEASKLASIMGYGKGSGTYCGD